MMSFMYFIGEPDAILSLIALSAPGREQLAVSGL